MTLWERIFYLLDVARDKTLGAVMDAMEAHKRKRDSAQFSIALIALSAKMAKADGDVTQEEWDAFGRFFMYPPEEEDKVRMIFMMAQEDVAGFDQYARKVARLFRESPDILEDVLDCLFYIALADGGVHPNELSLLESAAQDFALSEGAWRRIRALHLGIEKDDPYFILGVSPEESATAIKAAYRRLARENHPDILCARGVPTALLHIAQRRMAAINQAYAQIMAR